MSLFTVVPPAWFVPLAAPGAPVYAEVLLTLFTETRRHQQPLSRELALNLVRDVLANQQNSLLITADAESDDEPGDASDPLAGRAGAILRRLEAYGWLRVEPQRDFSRTYTLPDYAFRLLHTLNELANDEPLPLQGLIYAIYSMLQTSLREGNAHISLPEAHRQTMSLMSGLKELQHNIGVHIEQVLNQLQTRDVLEQVFTRYRGEIVDRAYHQLRTTDHVSRFRPGVLQALTQLSNEQQVAQVAQMLHASGMSPNIEAATTRLLTQIRDIREQFESLDRTMQAIDSRHSQFVDSAVRAVELQLTASSTTSGQLHAILTQALASEAPLADADMARLLDLFALQLVDADSLTAPTRAAVPFVPDATPAPQLTPQEIAEAHQQTLVHMQRSIGRERVRQFAATLLQDRDMIHGADIPLHGPDELPLLIYVRAYGRDGGLGYAIEELPDGVWIERDGVGFRDFVLRRVPASDTMS